MHRSHNNSKSHAYNFTLVELCVVCSIFAVLSSILVPVFRGLNQKAQALSCLANLSGHGKSISYYQNDYNDHFPLGGTFVDKRIPKHFRFQNSNGAFKVNKTNAMSIEGYFKTRTTDFLINGALAMAMYDDSPAKDVLQSIREKSNGSPINTWDIKNKIIEGAEIEGYEHFLCPSETKIKALNWLAEPKQTLNSISPALTGFTSHYGTNLGIVGRKNHADDLKQAKWDQESRSAQGRLQKIKSPSKSMFLGEMNMAEKISGWATFHAFDFNIPKYPIGMSLTDFLKTGQKDRFDMFRHGPLQTNILFVDGHASQVHFEDFSKVWMNKGIDR